MRRTDEMDKVRAEDLGGYFAYDPGVAETLDLCDEGETLGSLGKKNRSSHVRQKDDRRMCLRSVFKISLLFLRPRPWQFEI